jgi:D-alanyl-D-alanine carboxypeptidase
MPRTSPNSAHCRSRLGALFLLTSLFLLAGEPGAAVVLDEHIRAEMERQHVPGLAFAVVRDGRLVQACGYGFADLEHRVRVTPDSRFETGSIGKQFTAAAVMLFVEEGKLALDERVLHYLPDLPAAWKEITLRHLLTHTSGIPNYNVGEAALAVLQTDPPPDKVLLLVTGRPLEFEPGSRWSYSNTGYFLLGLVLERVSGRSYWDLVRERVFDPLGMKSTGPADLQQVIPDRVRGYGWNEKKGRIENRDAVRPRAAFSAGGFVSSVRDLARWDAWLRQGRLLKRSTLEQLWMPVRLNDGRTYPYGLGWMLEDVRDVPTQGHGGGTPGFATDLRTFENGRLTIILMANQRNVQEFDTLRGEIGGRYLQALLPLHHRKPRRDPDPERTELVRAVLADWAAGAKDSPRIAPRLQALHTPAVSALTRGRLDKLEAFEFLGAPDLGERKIERLGTAVREIAWYRMRSGGESFYYTFYLTEDRRVALFQSSTR